jgi:hypothetical protein
MANCVHCGRAAGLFRTYHQNCREQHDLAVKTIPGFFEKALRSSLPAERFDQLLRDAAAGAWIEPDRLRSLSIKGVRKMIDAVLADHLVTAAEEQRVIEIADAVGIPQDAMPDVHGKLVKAAVLRELDAGIIPDRIDVVGPLPLEFEPAETVIWIFNGVKCYRSQRAKDNQPAAPAQTNPVQALPAYYSLSSPDEEPDIDAGLIDEGVGDLVVTTDNLIMVWEDRQRSIPLARVIGFRARSDGVELARGTAQDRVNAFALDDPWFAANLLARLLRKNLQVRLPSDQQEHSLGPS